MTSGCSFEYADIPINTAAVRTRFVVSVGRGTPPMEAAPLLPGVGAPQPAYRHESTTLLLTEGGRSSSDASALLGRRDRSAALLAVAVVAGFGFASFAGSFEGGLSLFAQTKPQTTNAEDLLDLGRLRGRGGIGNDLDATLAGSRVSRTESDKSSFHSLDAKNLRLSNSWERTSGRRVAEGYEFERVAEVYRVTQFDLITNEASSSSTAAYLAAPTAFDGEERLFLRWHIATGVSKSTSADDNDGDGISTATSTSATARTETEAMTTTTRADEALQITFEQLGSHVVTVELLMESDEADHDDGSDDAGTSIATAGGSAQATDDGAAVEASQWDDDVGNAVALSRATTTARAFALTRAMDGGADRGSSGDST